MSSISTRAAGLGRQANQSDWVDRAARVGLLAYGVVHLVIAWLALQLAFGNREGQASSQGAVRELAQQPFGHALVWAVGVGMLLLAVWQVAEAVGRRELHKRVAAAGKAVVYAAVGIGAIKVAVGDQQKSKGTDGWTARLMDLPAGQVLVALVGLAIIAVGAYLVHKAWSEKFVKELDHEGRRGSSGTAFLWFGKIGYTAKGVAFAIVGILFGWAAVTHEPKKSGGLDQALRQLLDKPFGPVLLAAVALGLGCFGLFCLARARYLSRPTT